MNYSWISLLVVLGISFFSKKDKSIRRAQIILIFSLLIIFFISFFHKNSIHWTKLSNIQCASDSKYIFLNDHKNQKWIFKQILGPNPDQQIVIVMEVFASHISQSLDIPINLVKLVGIKENFPLRIFPNLPGSLHLAVPGEETENRLPWDNFDVHQKFRTPFQIQQKGALPSEDIGLRREIISNISKHRELAKIVAIDTFLGNSDRSNSNIFYNVETNSFYGIDMGSCLMGNLAQAAIDQLSCNKVPFSKEEIIGLKYYAETLESLISEFPPSKTRSLLSHYIKAAGFIPDNPLLWDEDLERKIKKWNRLIDESYISTIQLVTLINTIIEGSKCQPL